MNLFETVLARRAEDVLEGRKTSKWDSRWRVGVWLGKTEVSDEHLLYSSGEVTHHGTSRRFAETDPRRWQREEVLAMRVTPWYIMRWSSSARPEYQLHLMLENDQGDRHLERKAISFHSGRDV